MRIRLRKTVRRMLLLFIACSTFIVGLTAFYFYAEAATFLFKPKQPTPETTQSLTPEAATPPVFPSAPLIASTTQYRTTNSDEPVCANCISG
jgi:hypothetical protein